MTVCTLTTDFGTADGFVGAMKGVLASQAPHAVVVDIAHDIPRHDIAHGAWVLATSTRAFPPGSVHVAVVDPGVGGERAEVVVAIDGHYHVGPDNGLFAYLAAWGRVEGAWEIRSAMFRADVVAPTFHGRDVFAPAAAALARGLPPDAAGPPTFLVGRLPWSVHGRGEQVTAGVVVHIDHFGNLVTNLPGPARVAEVGGVRARPVRTYSDVAAGALAC
ncbi:MAG TPA: SAM-dependent chlorinase/fluorinase, partial [Kofleriaceae bacterium]|nr:SAM-dependent chlorinase/fluorinase [Kofleriaceae bacterium]